MVLVVKCLICKKELTYTQNDPSELITHVRKEHPLVELKKKREFQEDRRDFREEATRDWRQSLEFNAGILKTLIDKEIQTKIDWKYFVKMNDAQQSSNSKRDSKSPTNTQETIIEILSTPRSSSATAKLTDGRVNKKRIASKIPRPHNSKSQNTDIQRDNEIEMDVGREAKVGYSPDGKSKVSTNQKKSSRNEQRRIKFYKTSIEKWRPVGDEKIHCPRCESHKRPIVRTHTERVTQSSIGSTLLMTCWPICFAPCLFPEPTHENLHCPVCNYHLGVYDHRVKTVLSNPILPRAK